MLGYIPSTRADRLPAVLLAYAVALAAFVLLPPLFRGPASAALPVGFTLQEGLDLLTPLVVIPLAWYAMDLGGGLGRIGLVAFLLVAVLWVEGQAIHLAANGIGDAFPSPADADVFYRTPPGDLAHWLDEVASHWLWHLAWSGMSILLLATAMSGHGRSASGGGPLTGLAGLIHGGTLFMATTEGVTTMIGIPVSVGILLWTLVAVALGRSRSPIVTFLAVSSLATLLAYLGWAAANGWTLPEPCKTVLSC